MRKKLVAVHVRVDPDTKERADEALAAMGLSITDAVRMLLIKIAAERRLPFDVFAPREDAN